MSPFPLAGKSTASLDLESDVEDAADDLAREILGEYCTGAPWMVFFKIGFGDDIVINGTATYTPKI